MSLFIGGNDDSPKEKIRIKEILIFFLIFFPVLTGFELFSNIKSKKTAITELTAVYTPVYNFTPTPTMTPIMYPQLFYFKTKINQNLKFPALNTHYILSGNNDNKYKYWYVLITSPAGDDITFISYMFEVGEKAIRFEHVGNNTGNARYNFIRGFKK